MSYQRVDLNLFAVFDAIIKHHSVSAASRELGVTASAVSHGLARLRKLLGDDLFVSGPSGTYPTARALELAPNIQEGLGKLARAFESRAFDPRESTRSFVIAMTDYASTLTLPHLVRRVAQQAPNICLRVFPFGRTDVVQQLDEDRLQIVLGWFGALPERIHRRPLLIDQEALVVRAGHPLTQGPLSKERILQFPHVVVEVTGSEHQGNEGFIDDRGVLRRVWIERLLMENGGDGVGHVAVTVPHFSDVAPMLAVTDMVATLPRRLALRGVARDGLAMLAMPYQPLVVAHEMIWHERALIDPSTSWLIGQIEAAAEDIPIP